MVRALLAGTKTQTRRVMGTQPPASTTAVATFHHPDPRPMFYANDGASLLDWCVPCPYGAPGDRLWVREAFSGDHTQEVNPPALWNRTTPFWYWADGNPNHGDWTKPRPSIHMPRWASRITLNITGVRGERLQAISRGDAMAEGCPFPNMAKGDDPRQWFSGLWAEINGAESWEANPWVWVVDFNVAKD